MGSAASTASEVTERSGRPAITRANPTEPLSTLCETCTIPSIDPTYIVFESLGAMASAVRKLPTLPVRSVEMGVQVLPLSIV